MLKLYYKILLAAAFSMIALKSAKGQGEKYDVNEKIEIARQELMESKADTFLIYTTGCTGCYILHEKGYEPPCACEDESLNAKILWKEKGQSYLKEISCCNETVAKLNKLPGIFSFYEVHKTKLQKTKVGTTEVKNDGAKVISLPPSISHYSYQGVVMKLGHSVYEFYIKDYQKEGEYAEEWKKYLWLEAQAEWVKLIEKELKQGYSED
ncbi:hypothetical protein I2I11_17915 [Pontibacter sp. 172403-2]|uniref:hypothetical protein n=1 Tax=Pontibacter rufus TaxID=2791028 RepID=UPI0018AFCF89|nr:hypothetical protein [Pontibacter sp. 172403-2]MBF9255179.1 hypothetical protein [Pontibacter sp. 172403-2]